MGRRKLGNPEKSSASFEHEINFGFDYCVIPEVGGLGKEETCKGLVFKASFRKLM